jgi:hypothetical protein
MSNFASPIGAALRLFRINSLVALFSAASFFFIYEIIAVFKWLQQNHYFNNYHSWDNYIAGAIVLTIVTVLLLQWLGVIEENLAGALTNISSIYGLIIFSMSIGISVEATILLLSLGVLWPAVKTYRKIRNGEAAREDKARRRGPRS